MILIYYHFRHYMKTNLPFIIILVLSLTTTFQTKAQSQTDVPVIQVTDTLCNLTCGNVGTSTGVMFLPDGNSILAVWEGRPLIVDAYSGNIIRRLDSIPSSDVSNPKLSKDGSKLIATRMGPKFEVWDISTGKVIKMSDDIISRFCLSPDGTKLYCTKWKDESNQSVIAVYDMNNFERTETFCNNFNAAGDIAISPDGQTLAVEVFKDPENENDKKTTQVILIDLKDKSNYTVIETLEPSVYSIAFSPNGKNLAFAYVGQNPNIYICIYNLETKTNTYILKSEMEKLIGSDASFGNPLFLNDDILILSSAPSDLTWSINENKFKKIINFNAICADVNGNKLLLCGHLGSLAILDFTKVNVQDKTIQNISNITYNNNQLRFYSEKTFVSDVQIFDLSGKTVFYLAPQSFVSGQNIVPIDKSLPAGVYIVVINNGSEQISRKFVKIE